MTNNDNRKIVRLLGRKPTDSANFLAEIQDLILNHGYRVASKNFSFTGNDRLNTSNMSRGFAVLFKEGTEPDAPKIKGVPKVTRSRTTELAVKVNKDLYAKPEVAEEEVKEEVAESVEEVVEAPTMETAKSAEDFKAVAKDNNVDLPKNLKTASAIKKFLEKAL